MQDKGVKAKESSTYNSSLTNVDKVCPIIIEYTISTILRTSTKSLIVLRQEKHAHKLFLYSPFHALVVNLLKLISETGSRLISFTSDELFPAINFYISIQPSIYCLCAKMKIGPEV